MSALFRRLGRSTASAASSASARSFSTSSARARAHITVLGHLADAPEPITAPNGRELVRYTVASQSGSKDNRVTSWFRVTSFDQGAFRDFVLSTPKGSLVYVEGEASIDTYNGPDGKPKSAFKVTQRHIEVLKRPAAENNPDSSNSAESTPYHEHREAE